MENYKKWIIVGIIALIAGIVVINNMNRQSERTAPSDSGRSDVVPPSGGPLVDQDFDKVVPLEELGADLNNAQSLAVLGDQFFETKRYKQAIEIYGKVIELNPNDIDTYNDLGLAYQYTGQQDLAIDTLRKGAAIGQSYQRIWLSLGFVLMSKGENEEAKNALKKAVEINPATDVGQEATRILGLIK